MRPSLKGVRIMDLDEKKKTLKAYSRAYYLENSSRIKARVSKRWAENPEAKKQDKACRDKKRDKIRAYDRMRAKRDREKKKIILARWATNNPERVLELARIKQSRRRSRKRLAGGNHSADDILKQKSSQRDRCWWCGDKLRCDYHVDHRIPLARGGSNGAGNIVISCPPCNRSKNAQMPWEFSGRLL